MKTLSVQSITTISLMCLVGFLLSPFITYGFFSSQSESIQNSFSFATLETAISPLSVSDTISSTAITSFSLTLSDIGSLTAQYQVTAEASTCAPLFSDGLDVSVSVGTSTIASSSLLSLTGTHPTATTLMFDIITNSSWLAADTETCVFDIVVIAWQDDFGDNNQGFSDEVRVPVTLTADVPVIVPVVTNVVLNEIYPAPLATTTVPLEREWIELYNGTGAPIDVANWVIGEFVGGNPLNTERPHTIVSDCTGLPVSTHMQPVGGGSTVVPAGGYLLVEFCGTASYLFDAGDTVILYDNTNTVIDSHAYPATVPGKSHARIPDGGAWVDPVPTPGGFNTATEADLEAEGWSPELIEQTLSELSRLQSEENSRSEENVSTGQFVFATNELPIATATSATTTTTTTVGDFPKATTTRQESGDDLEDQKNQTTFVSEQNTVTYNNDETIKDNYNPKDTDDVAVASSTIVAEVDKFSTCLTDCEEDAELDIEVKDETEFYEDNHEQTDTTKKDSVAQSDSPIKKEEANTDTLDGSVTEESALTPPAE